MNRSSPVNVAPISVEAPPALIARAARYSPTGQPSVRWTSSSTSASVSSTPAAVSNDAGVVAVHRQIFDPDLHEAALRSQPSCG